MSEATILPRKTPSPLTATSDILSPIPNYINGRFIASTSGESLPVTNPSTGETITQVPLSTGHDVDQAIRAAAAAFPSWSTTTIKERSQVFYRYKALMEKNLRD